jgi:uncharacterized alkaline shock family protein YloU
MEMNDVFSQNADPENHERISTGAIIDSESGEDEMDGLAITDEVIAVVAGTAAMEVETVAEMSTGFAGDIVEVLGRKNPTRGVKVLMDEDRAVIDLYVIVKYGHKISDIAWDIQEKVKETVENMTGVIVESVNIHVQGIDFSDYEQLAEN